jgi:hypothetical protein
MKTTTRIIGALCAVALAALAALACDDVVFEGDPVDAGADTDADADTDTDADSDTDTDAGLGETVDITVVNDALESRYIDWGISWETAFYGARALGCSYSADGADAAWSACLTNAPDCDPICSDYEPGGDCGVECEPSNLIKEILPGESLVLPWPRQLYAGDTDICADAMTCYDAEAAPDGLYQFAIIVYSGLDCGAGDCEPNEDGVYADETPTEPAELFTVDVALPDAASTPQITIGE